MKGADCHVNYIEVLVVIHIQYQINLNKFSWSRYISAFEYTKIKINDESVKFIYIVKINTYAVSI